MRQRKCTMSDLESIAAHHPGTQLVRGSKGGRVIWSTVFNGTRYWAVAHELTARAVTS